MSGLVLDLPCLRLIFSNPRFAYLASIQVGRLEPRFPTESLERTHQMALKQRLSTARFSLLLLVLALSSGCAASSAFKRGKEFEKLRNYDEAMANYRIAYEKEPKKY